MKSIERIELLYGLYLEGSGTEQQEQELRELLSERDLHDLTPELRTARRMLAGFDNLREREDEQMNALPAPAFQPGSELRTQEPGIPAPGIRRIWLRRLALGTSIAAIVAAGLLLVGVLALQDRRIPYPEVFACINGVEYTDPEAARAELSKILHKRDAPSATGHALSKLKPAAKGFDLMAKPRIAGQILNEKLQKI